MNKKNAVLYARVSSEKQDLADKVSIDQQIADMQKTADHNGWTIVSTFVDSKDYVATKKPKRGKKVNPSGTRDDRPGLLAMLEKVKTGDVDIILCWADDRLYRHERVVTLIKDALEEAEARGRGEVQIWQTGGIITKDFMYLQAMMWRKENERRAERLKMGRVGTLQAGRWPGQYLRLGYSTVKTEGKRGAEIVLADEGEVETVKKIYQWYDNGLSIVKIRRQLITQATPQKGVRRRIQVDEWAQTVISNILRSPDYLGLATWDFGDHNGCKLITIPQAVIEEVQQRGAAQWQHKGGPMFSIKIPAIIAPDQWQRVQKRLGNQGINRKMGKRNTKEVYLLQGLLFCGECGRALYARTIKHTYKKLATGENKRYLRRSVLSHYICSRAANYPQDGHPHPCFFNVAQIDSDVWRYLVDNIIKQPNVIRAQVARRQAAALEQASTIEADIAKLKQRLEALEADLLTYTRQLARGKISEAVYDSLIAENDERKKEAQDELAELEMFKDNSAAVSASLDYAYSILAAIRQNLDEVDIAPEDFKTLPEDRQHAILLKRQGIIRALVDRVVIFASGRIEIEGLFDSDKVSSFDLISTRQDLLKLRYLLTFDLSEVTR